MSPLSMRLAVLPVALCLLTAPTLSCAQALPTQADVRRVVDGDTIELTDGRLVRYIGIDAPESRSRQGERWVEDPEPFSEAATEANRRLVEGKAVALEYDAQTHDRYGRLLAYVFVDGRMVNAALIEEGYAQTLTIPPNVRHASLFRRLAREARSARRGLWGTAPDPPGD